MTQPNLDLPKVLCTLKFSVIIYAIKWCKFGTVSHLLPDSLEVQHSELWDLVDNKESVVWPVCHLVSQQTTQHGGERERERGRGR